MARKKDTETKAPVVEKKKSRSSAAKESKDSLKDIKELADAPATTTLLNMLDKPEPERKPRVQQLDAQGRAYATGRRKNAVARVWIKPGRGTVIVNGRDQTVYFARQTQRLVLNQPFLIVNRMGQFDVVCTVTGGGLSGQAGAVRHGISRALENYEPDLRPALKKAGMLTRDSRVVERKKVGLHKARRSKQWAKR